MSKEMLRVFCMVRKNDESGTSGTGEVLEGIVFSTGKVAVCWKSKKTPVHSVSVFDSYDEFYKIHIGQHPTNGTEIIWKSVNSDKHKPEEVEAIGY